MNYSSSSISSCRHCQFYSPQGRRGGHCRKLNVAVKSQWNACSLATPPFAASWKELESITIWTQHTLMQEDIVLAREGSVSTGFFEPEQLVPIPVASKPHSTSWM